MKKQRDYLYIAIRNIYNVMANKTYLVDMLVGNRRGEYMDLIIYKPYSVEIMVIEHKRFYKDIKLTITNIVNNVANDCPGKIKIALIETFYYIVKKNIQGKPIYVKYDSPMYLKYYLNKDLRIDVDGDTYSAMEVDDYSFFNVIKLLIEKRLRRTYGKICVGGCKRK